jgi:hypothetical protein
MRKSKVPVGYINGMLEVLIKLFWNIIPSFQEESQQSCYQYLLSVLPCA